MPAEQEVPEQTFEVSAELDPDKDVEHRVEAAVGEGNVAADEQGIIQLLADLAALNDAKFQQCLQKQDRSLTENYNYTETIKGGEARVYMCLCKRAKSRNCKIEL